MSKPNVVKFQKIPLKMLIDELVNLYNMGADYVDISGVADQTQDIVTISVEDEYMIPNQPKPDEPIIFENDKLSDQDIDDLLHE